MKKPETISVEELERRMSRPGVVVVDLRSAGEYREMHIPGSIHVPYENLGQMSRYRDKSIILYCDGSRCYSGGEGLQGLLPERRHTGIYGKKRAHFLTERTGCGYNSFKFTKEKSYEESTV